MKLFTKSAFKQALFCPASLYYYYDSEHYANQMSEDDFLQALADGGNQVGDLAKVYYDVQPDADINELDYATSLAKTEKLMERDSVNIAEAAFRWGDCFVRADIIEKKGNQINLIEVKAKSWSPGDSFVGKRNPNQVASSILEYVYDVAFQKYVIQKALGPDYAVKAHLMMADKSVVSDAPKGVNQFFRVVKDKNGRTSIIRERGAEDLRKYARVLTAYDVDELCSRIIAGTTAEQPAVMGCPFEEFVEKMSKRYVGHTQEYCKLDVKCFGCPFVSNEKTPGMKDGRQECWEHEGYAEDTFKKPMIADLWAGGAGAVPIKKNLMEKGKIFLADVEEEDLPKSKDVESGLTPAQRRLLQIAMTTGDKAKLKPFEANIHNGVYLDVAALRKEMDNWKYPLHMIDFETTAVALPFYPGRRPYEQIAFQFSHHVIEKDGSIRHEGEYINTAKHQFPNFEFVKKLKEQLEKDEGTIFRYAAHENTILRAIYDQLADSDVSDKDELMDFIDSITHCGNHRGERDMVDLLEVVKRYYYHPDMKGSNSIKVVLPAILNSSKAIQRKYEQPIYGTLIPSGHFKNNPKAWISYGPDGKVENPYKQLDEIATFLNVTQEELEAFDDNYGLDESIANGGAALAAYTKLQFSNEQCTKALEEALLRYCELDTMSMVFIWEYFHEMVSAYSSSSKN